MGEWKRMETAVLKFHEITLADKAWMDKKFAEDNRNACEYTFVNNFIWRKAYRVEVAEICQCLVIRFHKQEQDCYSYPVGNGDKKAAIQTLLFACKEKGAPLVMSPLSVDDKRQLQAWFPGRFLLEAERDSFDYIYAREKLATLAGKKMHGKRNHIARFKDGGDWSYEPMTDANLEECRTMTYSWMKMRAEKWNEEMEEEVVVLHEAFDHRKELGLIGGVLRREGEIVAFSMGEPLNQDTFVVHFEKAYPDMQGAYPMINQQFVQNACTGYTYINREEDTGDEGLRKAKLSYYPEILLEKYKAVESDIVYADRSTDGTQIAAIWNTCFGDSEAYIRFYLENRMTDANMLVAYRDGKAAAMASFLPVRYLCGGAYMEARYVYAVATLPQYRRQGLAARILTFAQKHYGLPLILAPAEERLCGYYEKLGFRRAFSDSRTEYDSSLCALSLPDAGEAVLQQELEPVSADVYVRLRDERFAREGYVQWDEAAVAYAIKLCEQNGGGAATLENATGGKEFLLYEKEGETLCIVETSFTAEALAEVLPKLLEKTQTSRARAGQLSGMLWLPDALKDKKTTEDGYLALTLG